jgi:hypothetical protein
MSHRVELFIARKAILENMACTLNQAHLILLPQGFALIPNINELFDEITNHRQSKMNEEFEIFDKISGALISHAENLSHKGPIAYIETNYFGGIGTQSAVVWSETRIIYGPCQSETKWVNGQHVTKPAGETAINRALRLMGVQQENAFDEFDAIELGKFRNNEDWLKQTDRI